MLAGALARASGRAVGARSSAFAARLAGLTTGLSTGPRAQSAAAAARWVSASAAADGTSAPGGSTPSVAAAGPAAPLAAAAGWGDLPAASGAKPSKATRVKASAALEEGALRLPVDMVEGPPAKRGAAASDVVLKKAIALKLARGFATDSGAAAAAGALVPEDEDEDLDEEEEDEEDDETISLEEEMAVAQEIHDPELKADMFGLHDEINRALSARGIEYLFPIQAQVMKPAMAGKDVIARARTGTGKTLAFALPIIHAMLQEDGAAGTAGGRVGRRTNRPRALIMAPTRELAKQVEREFATVAPGLVVGCFYGGVSISLQERRLRQGVDIAVGTPGRIIDLLDRGWIDLSECRFVTLDEADQMLAVGFADDVERIMSDVPPGRQTMLFSATMPFWVQKLAKKYMNAPTMIDLVGDARHVVAETVTTMAVRTTPQARKAVLVDLLHVYARAAKTIVFANTKADADDIAGYIGRAIACEPLHGDIAQAQREKTLKAFRDGRFNVLVATDVASRGLDIPNVDLVVHYELPMDTESYTHRTGRTGRAGKSGTAMAIVTEREMGRLRGIERETGAKVSMVDVPTTQEVMMASAEQARLRLLLVEDGVLPFFAATAEDIIAKVGATKALSAALATLAGFKTAPRPRSLLSQDAEFRTVRVAAAGEGRGRVPLASTRDVMAVVNRMVAGGVEPRIGKIRMLLAGEGACFDVSHEVAEAIVKNEEAAAAGLVFDLPAKLPALAPEATREGFGGRGGYGGRGGGGGGRYGGDRGGRGGGGGRSYGGERGSYGGGERSSYGGGGGSSYGGGERSSYGGGGGGGGIYGDRSSSRPPAGGAGYAGGRRESGGYASGGGARFRDSYGAGGASSRRSYGTEGGAGTGAGAGAGRSASAPPAAGGDSWNERW